MPPITSHIPLPGTNHRYQASAARSCFNTPTRWVLAALAWLAFVVAGYLAFNAVTGSSVAGCGLGGSNGCDIVLTSSWSKWLGVPVAVLGLACYALLASLAVVLGLGGAALNRCITTLFVMLAVVAAGASLWFIGVQVVAIGNYCLFCLITDVCGIALGAIAVVAGAKAWWASRRKSDVRPLQPARMAIRPTIPTTGGAGRPAFASLSPPLSLPVALAGALPLLVALVGGQLLFASKTFHEEKVALNQAIKLDVPGVAASLGEATPRVAMRVPSEIEGDEIAAKPSETTTAGSLGTPSEVAATAPNPAPRERLVQFLGGKLTLDVYKHPLIGSPEAPHFVIEMVSYDCPHCRKMHAVVQEALARYGDQVALLVMPIPLDKECNSLITDPSVLKPGACGTARLVLGFAHLNPTAFGRFHDFLMTGKEKPPGMEKIIPKAYGLVNSERLRELMRGDDVKKQLEGYVNLYGQLMQQSNGGKVLGLPVQILGDSTMSGSVEKSQDVFKAWETNLGVVPK